MNLFRSRKVDMIWSFSFLGVCKRTKIPFVCEYGLAIEWNSEDLTKLLEGKSDEFVFNHERDKNDTLVIFLKSDLTIKVQNKTKDNWLINFVETIEMYVRKTTIDMIRGVVKLINNSTLMNASIFDRGIKPAIGFMKPFGCHVTILNTLDKLGKFDGKSDEGFFVGYSLSSKAFRVYNIRTRKVQENLHVGFLENKPMLEGNGPKWLFDLDSLTQSMNYVPVVAGTFSNVSAGIQGVSESSTSSQQDQDCIVMPIWKDASYFDDSSLKSVDDAQLQDQDGTHDDCSLQDNGTDDQQVNAASPEVNIDLMGPIPTTEDTQVEDQEIELGNLSPSYAVSSTPHTRIHKDHPIDHEELLQFKLQNVWVLVDLPKGHRAIGTKSFIEAIEYSWLMLLFRVLQSTNGCQGGSYMVKLKGGYDIIFGSTKKELCDEFKKLMKDKFQMSSMGELTFFLGLQVQQRKKASLFSHDKLSMKFEKVSNTRCEHLVPDIRYLKGKPSLGLWYSKDSSLELIAYTDSGVVELTLDRWSTIEVVMFLGKIAFILTISFMANLEFCDKHNMVAFLDKSTGSAGFHQIIDFLNRSHICYALTKKPEVCVSFIKQFWRSAEASTDDHGEVKINATIDDHSLSITEGSLRRHLKLADQDGITSLPNSEIFEQLALMGYHTDSDKLTFQKGVFSPQWRFLIHKYLSLLSPKKEALGAVLVFSNMKRPTKGFSGQEVALFPTMLAVPTPSTLPSKITSSPSPYTFTVT
ncbi:putative ribonuclease H-like domain-containing protein [Tanacetum coccineum]